MENRLRVGLANILYTESREKKTGKKNGSSHLVDLGTFRLFRRTCDESTWPGVPLLVLAFTRQLEASVYNSACKNIVLNLEKRKTYHVQMFSSESDS